MFKKYTEKDFTKLAEREVKDNNKKEGTDKFYYLSHYIKIDDDDCSPFPPLLVVEMKKVYSKSICTGQRFRITETVYSEIYI